MTWHNQVTILKQSFIALTTVIGQGLINALKPALKALNVFLGAAIDFAEKVVNALGQIFGWKYEITGGGIADDTLSDIDDISESLGGLGDENALSGATDGIDGIGDALDDATDAAEEFKATILGFDELNVLNDVSDTIKSATGNGGGSGGSGGTGKGDDADALVGLGGAAYSGSDLEGHLEKTEGLMTSAIKDLYSLGKYIADSLKDVLDDINWEAIYEKARNFGTGLAQFLNGLLQPETFYSVGRTIANGLNTAVQAGLAFVDEFDWKNAGDAINAGLRGIFENIQWDEIKRLADGLGQGIAEYLNHLFTPQLFSEVGDAFAQALNSALHFIDNFGRTFDFRNFGESLSAGLVSFITGIEWETALSAAKEWGQGVANALNAFIESGPKEKWYTVGKTVGNAVKTGLVFIATTANEIHWDEAGQAFADAINGFFDDVSGEDLAEAINGILNGLVEAIGELKKSGAWGRVVHEIAACLKALDWGAIATLMLTASELDFGLSIAGGIKDALTGNPVRTVLGTGMGLLADAAKLALAAKFLGVGGGGTSVAAAGVAAGEGVGAAIVSGLGTALLTIGPIALLIAGLLGMNDPECQKKIEEGQAALTRFQNDLEKNQALSYQNMNSNSSGYWNTEVTTAEEAAGKIKKTYDSLGRETGELVETNNRRKNESYASYWSRVLDDAQKNGTDLTAIVKAIFGEDTDIVNKSTEEQLALVKQYTSGVKTEHEGFKDKLLEIVGTTWSESKNTTETNLSETSDIVNEKTGDIRTFADNNLSDIPDDFETYFRDAKDNAIWHLDDLANYASSLLGNISSWLDDAISNINGVHGRMGTIHNALWEEEFASGGFPTTGEVFLAREEGPEMVGRIGGRTAVANNADIVAGIRAGVMDGMMQVFSATNGGRGSEPIQNDVVIKFGEDTIYRAVLRGKEKYDRRYSTVAVVQ